MMKLKQFVPDFLSGEAIPDDPKDRWGLTMPNLHYGWEHGSSMDIKMGQCTETPWMIEATRQKKYRQDRERSTNEHGYTIVGAILRDPNTGEKTQKVTKLHPKSVDESRDWLRKMFTQTTDGKIDAKAVSYVSQELAKMTEFMKNTNEHEIRGMSIFIIIDSIKQLYTVKIIDLVSFEQIPQDEGPVRDEGVIKGFNSLLDLMAEIQVEEPEVE